MGDSASEEVVELLPGSSNTGLERAIGVQVSPDQNGSLHQRLASCQQSNDGIGVVDVVVGDQLQLLELRVLANQVLDGAFHACDDAPQQSLVGRLLHVEDDVYVNTQLLSDRQGLRGRVSMRVVEDGHACHLVLLSGGRPRSDRTRLW